jgi:hypothetical protein
LDTSSAADHPSKLSSALRLPAPTGRRIEMQEISILRIADDRFAVMHVRRSGEAAATGCQRRTFAQDIEDLKDQPACAVPEVGRRTRDSFDWHDRLAKTD